MIAYTHILLLTMLLHIQDRLYPVCYNIATLTYSTVTNLSGPLVLPFLGEVDHGMNMGWETQQSVSGLVDSRGLTSSSTTWS